MRGIVNNCDCVIEIRDARVSESFFSLYFLFSRQCLCECFGEVKG